MNNNKEIWKTINDSDGHYFISNLGNMRREEYYFVDKIGKNQYRKEKNYTPIFNKQNGYYSYKYRGKDGSSKNQYVHKLVALHFIVNPNPNCLNEVNHKNCDKSINEDWNLEWCNRKGNMEHASKNNLINRDSEKRKKQAPINSAKGIHKLFKSIVEYDENGNLLNIYDSYNKILNENGNKSTICCHRLSYRNKYYRVYDILMEQYNKIPEKINIQYIKSIQNNKKKKYKSYKDQEIVCYNKLSEIPITREELWFCFNHNLKDSNGYKWDILNI